MTLPEIATILRDAKKSIILIYAFNATGKTRLSVAYKDATKTDDGTHAGVYYNAFSEDIFVWDNDSDNGEENIQLMVNPSSLNRLHASLNEGSIREKLKAYKPKYDFSFNLHDDSEEGIESITFFIGDADASEQHAIKISRSEERVFVWCFFLALFEVGGWADKQSSHFFIDDPVSSLDDHNIFVTAFTLYDLIESHHADRKIIITTHHIGLFSILADLMTKGEKSKEFTNETKLYTLSGKSDDLTLENCRNDVFLYHLRLLQVLEKANNENDVRAYHFALLRQVLENVGSFLGRGQFSYVLQQIGIEAPDKVATIINTLSHKKVYYYESDALTEDNQKIFSDIFKGLKAKYNFKLHAPAPTPEEAPIS